MLLLTILKHEKWYFLCLTLKTQVLRGLTTELTQHIGVEGRDKADNHQAVYRGC